MFFRDSINYQRERLTLVDGDFLDLDFSKVGADNLVIVVHGLEGSSQSNYIISVVKQLNKLNMDALALNLRGCSGEDNKKIFSYNSGKSDDLDPVIHYILNNCTYKNIFLLGYSMGGNIVLKFLGEGRRLSKMIKGAAAISVPCDLAGSSEKLAAYYNRLYMWVFLRTLKKKALQKMERFPNHGLDKNTILSSKNFYDFDNAVTAPLFGFQDAKDYWTSCSSKQFLSGIHIPTLLINALDDSFLSPSCYPIKIADQHNSLFLEMPKYGGHVGFNTTIVGRDTKWSENRIATFFLELLK